MTSSSHDDFTPALGRHAFTADYDRIIALMTRERHWRAPMLAELAPREGQTIVDIGSGTGTFALLIKQAAPSARVIALDPDPQVRAIAERKAQVANIHIEFVTGMGDTDVSAWVGVSAWAGGDEEALGADAVVSSLVLHQCPMDAKRAILANAHAMLRRGGRLLICDYGKQRGLLMRLAFNLVRQTDGYTNTKANKDGVIPGMIANAGFERVEELKITMTPTGSISLYSAWKPD